MLKLLYLLAYHIYIYNLHKILIYLFNTIMLLKIFYIFKIIFAVVKLK